CLVIVNTEEIHAESGPAGDTVLKIPTFRVEKRGLKPGEEPADPVVWVVSGSGDHDSNARVDESKFTATCQAALGTADGATTTLTCMQPSPLQDKEGEAPHPASLASQEAGAGHEIVLPIPTREFHDLFTGFRRRTLLLFLGVFALGT